MLTIIHVVIGAIVAEKAFEEQMSSDDYDYDEDVKGVCLLSHNHKPLPSAEPMLEGQCRQWRDNACCRPKIPQGSWSDRRKEQLLHKQFDHSHCGEIGQTCLMAMYRQWCLYQCDPYLEPWIRNDTKVTTTTMQPPTTEMTVYMNDTLDYNYDDLADFLSSMNNGQPHRIWHAPLCHDDCQRWWDSCRQELTCTSDWYTGFDWEEGLDGDFHNTCKNRSDCKPIDQWFNSATDFCENIFPGDYKVAAKNDVCISFYHPEHNYNASQGNNSRRDDREIAIVVCASLVSVLMLVGFVFLFRRRGADMCLNARLRYELWRDGSADGEIVQHLAAEDHLQREVHA